MAKLSGGLTDDQIAAAGGAEEGGPESFLNPATFKPSPGQRKFKNQTGPIQQVRQRTAEEKSKYYVPQTAEEAFTVPVYSALDRFTGGLVTGAARAASGVIPTASDIARSVDEYRSGYPVLSNVTDAPAYISPESAPARIATTVDRALPTVTTGAGRLAKTIIGGGATNAALGALDATSRGATPAQTGDAALHSGAVGTALSTALGIPTSLAGTMARAIINSRGGQARQFLESRGVPVSLTSAGRPGHITDADIGAAAERADQSVKEGLAQYREDVASAPYRNELNKITPAQQNQLVDVTPIFSEMAQAYQHPSTRPEIAAELKRQMDIMTANYTPGSGPIMMTQDYVNGLRQSLGGAARFDSNEARFSPIKRGFQAAKDVVDQGPYAEANRVFHEGDQDYQQSLDMLDLRKTKKRGAPIGGNLSTKARRLGQNTVTAGADAEKMDVDAFREKHPDLALQLDEPEILRRSADIGFSLRPKQHGGLIERLGSMGAGLAGLEGVAQALGHGHVDPKAVALSTALGLGLQNMPAIQARLLFNPSLGVQALEPLVLSDIPLVSAARNARGDRQMTREIQGEQRP